MTTVVALSPHLDDAVMSIGGTMHRWRRAGVSIRVVTLFAGDLAHPGPPSAWDAGRGNRTAAEAFCARRAEDREAAAVLDVESVWLSNVDASYLAPRDPDALWAMVRPHLADADAVLAPGSPLTHPDHEYTAALAVDHVDETVPLLFYAELPYASRPRHLRDSLRGTTPAQLQHLLGARLEWTNIHLDSSDRTAKHRAMRCYAGELAALGGRVHLDRLVAGVLRRETIGRRTGAPLPGVLIGAQ